MPLLYNNNNDTSECLKLIGSFSKLKTILLRLDTPKNKREIVTRALTRDEEEQPRIIELLDMHGRRAKVSSNLGVQGVEA